MDAYSSYILRVTEARLEERRREAAVYALSRPARQRRGSLWTRIRGTRRSRPSVVPMPRPTTAFEPEAEFPQSA